jgi:hypothetical protein
MTEQILILNEKWDYRYFHWPAEPEHQSKVARRIFEQRFESGFYDDEEWEQLCQDREKYGEVVMFRNRARFEYEDFQIVKLEKLD